MVFSFVIFFGLLLMTVIFAIWQGKVDIQELISEAGQNVSRFQMMIFTVLFATIIFLVAANKSGFPEVPPGFIYLMAASYGVYFIDKGADLIGGKTNRDIGSRLDNLEKRLARLEEKLGAEGHSAESQAERNW